MLPPTCFTASSDLAITRFNATYRDAPMTRRHLIRIFGALFLFLFAHLAAASVPALDGQKPPSYYAIDTWRDELPQSTALALRQTHDGYFWIGTYEGLVRFDGVRFTVFDKRNTPAFTGNGVRALYEDRRGTLWIGVIGGGLVRYADGAFSTVTVKDGLAGNFCQAICEDRAGRLWVGTTDGLSRLENGVWKTFTTRDGLPSNNVYALTVDADDRLWIGTYGGGAATLYDGKFTAYGVADGLAGAFVFSILADRRNVIWIGTERKGLCRLENGRFTTYTTKDGLGDDSVPSLYEDEDGSLWIGSESHGVRRLRNGVFSKRTVEDHIAHEFIRSICGDREGSLWVGTSGAGVSRLREGKFSNLTANDGLPGDNVRVVLEDSKGRMWFGADAAGVARVDADGDVMTYTTKNGLTSDAIRSLVEDRAGNIWVGTNGGGLNRIRDGVIARYTTAQGLASDNIFSLCAARDGKLWIGGVGGINVFENGALTAFSLATAHGRTGKYVRTILEDRDGGMWFGAIGLGLFRFKDGTLKNYTQADGLASNTVFSLHEDADGSLWIGGDGGLTHFKDGKFFTFTVKHGLFDDISFVILEDSDENFWLSGNRGVSRVSKRQLLEVERGETDSVICDAFGKSDGMGANQCNGTSQPAGWKAQDGRLWFPTINGAAVVDPHALPANRRPPPVKIETVVADDVVSAFPSRVEIAPGAKKFEFHYTALSFLAPERVKFRYLLEGIDKKWVDAAGRRVAYYTNLPPGVYRFRVAACNNDGVWNIAGATVTVAVKPYFYQTLWAQCAFVALGAGAVYGGVRWRVRRLRQRAEVLEIKVAERTDQLNSKNLELAKAIEDLRTSQSETEEKNRLLVRKNEELVTLHRRADLIFSALAEALPGTVIEGKYRLEEKIGAGGFGAVYRATHLGLSRSVAVKVFRPSENNATAASVERFRLEGVSACRINHPNAVSVLDSGVSAEGVAYLVMELLNGRSLAAELSRERRLSVARCLEILIPVCEALAAAHAAGIIHRDVKPDNIFLHHGAGGEEIVKVVDFGIAKLLGEDLAEDLANMTDAGGIVGTPLYMAPERLSRAPYDGRSDIYSLGVVFYQMLSGRVPFPPGAEGNIMAILLAHLQQPPPPLRAAVPDLPPDVEDLALRALVKNPAQRPTAREFADALAKFLPQASKRRLSPTTVPLSLSGPTVIENVLTLVGNGIGEQTDGERAPETIAYSDGGASEDATTRAANIAGADFRLTDP
jgi:ligand-binding sensor domain-containing protein/serine/threonine protein kinase